MMNIDTAGQTHPELLALEIVLKNDNFLTVKETLSRIGIASEKTKTLWQSCHILQKAGKYYIVHFKEMFLLDGKPTSYTEQDVIKRNSIAEMLRCWGLIDIIGTSPGGYENSYAGIKVVKNADKPYWQLIPKYTIGKHKKVST